MRSRCNWAIRFVYDCEYTPRHAADNLPDGWTDNAEVQIKVTDKHHVWVKQPGGIELQLIDREAYACSHPIDGSQTRTG